MNWRNETIFVTGATGFIGGRVCERLVQAGVTRVRALVHSMHRAARIGRLPVELCSGNLLDPDSLRTALGGAKIVIHCGLGNAGAILTGTENLLALSQQAGVKRFIHMSTAAVYGLTPPPGCEQEEAPLRTTGDGYCDNKGRAEGAVLRYIERGLPAVILRPSIVWGPYSAWSIRLIPDLKEGRVTTINRGSGACNTTHVDNLVDAIFASIENDRAVGKTFFITDGEAITWGDFIRAHVAMLDEHISLPDISGEEALAYYRQRPGVMVGSVKAMRRILRSKELRLLLLQIPIAERGLKAVWGKMESMKEDQRARLRTRFGVRPKPPASRRALGQERLMPDEVTLATQTTTVFFSIEKARDVLGYQPRVSFAQGIHMVEQWLRYANYL